MKKRSDETQTLRAGCSEAEPKVFAPPKTPFPGAPDGQNLISWKWSLILLTNPVWWGSMHAISSYRGNRPHKQTGPITIHCAASSAQYNKHVYKYKLQVDKICTCTLGLYRRWLVTGNRKGIYTLGNTDCSYFLHFSRWCSRNHLGLFVSTDSDTFMECAQ